MISRTCKSSILCFVLLFQATFALAQNNEFTFKGEVNGKSNGYMYLVYQKSWGKICEDSFLIKDGYFEFKGVLEEPTLALFCDSAGFNCDNWIEIFIEPGQIIGTLNYGDFKTASIKGSKSNNEYFKYLEVVKVMNDSQDFIKYSEEKEKAIYKFIESHLDSYVSPYIMYHQYYEVSSFKSKIYYSRLSTRMQNSNVGLKLKEYLRKTETILMGNKAPLFSVKDVSGYDLSLGKFSGKFVLLHFWATWGTSEYFDSINDAFAQFSEKDLVIINISLDRQQDKSKWESIINEGRLKGFHYCDFEGIDGVLPDLYNVRGSNVSILIGPDGKIVKHVFMPEILSELESYIND